MSKMLFEDGILLLVEYRAVKALVKLLGDMRSERVEQHEQRSEFRAVEAAAKAAGKPLKEMTIGEMEALWEKAKAGGDE